MRLLWKMEVMETVSVSIPKLASLDTLELNYDKDNVEPLIKSECYVKRSSKSNSSVGDSFGECKGVVVLYISSSAP